MPWKIKRGVKVKFRAWGSEMVKTGERARKGARKKARSLVWVSFTAY